MALNLARLQNATAQDVLDNPKAYGVPTLSEYAKNPVSFLPRQDRTFASVDRGSKLIKSIQKQTYEIEDQDGLVYSCKSLEQVESVALQMGIKIGDLEIKPEVISEGGGKSKLIVRFRRKSSLILPQGV